MFPYQSIPATSFQQNSTSVWCNIRKEAVQIVLGDALEKVIIAREQHTLTLEKIVLTPAYIDYVRAEK